MVKKIIKVKTLATKKEKAKTTKKIVKPAVKKVTKKVEKKKVAVKKVTLKVKKPAIKKIVSTKKPAKPIKKLVIKKVEPKEKKLGRVLNYYDKIKVIAIKLKDDLSVGDTIRVRGGQDTDFKQKITSMQIDGKKVVKAKKGQGIGFKVKDKARSGYWVYKILK